MDPKLIQPFIQTAVEAFGYDRLCFEANCKSASLYSENNEPKNLIPIHSMLRCSGPCAFFLSFFLSYLIFFPFSCLLLFQGFFCNFVDSMDGFSTWVDVLVPMLKEIGASEADLEMLFRTNAMRVYGIV